MVRFAWIKSSVNKVVDLLHIWPWPLTWPVTLAMNFQGQISYLIVKYLTEGEFFGWLNILLILSDVRFAFIIYSSAIQVWHFCCWKHTRDHIAITMAMVCILGLDTCLGVVLGFTLYPHRLYMKFAQSQVTKTQIFCKLWLNLLHLFIHNWNADRLMEGWTAGTHHNHTIWPRAEMEYRR